jgi:hypothetical protein
VKKYLVMLAVAAVAVFAIVATSGAQAPGPRTIVVKESSKGSKFKFIDEKPYQRNPERQPPSMGDNFVFYAPLLDASGKRVGEIDVRCDIVKPGRHEIDVCDAAVNFADGDLFLVARVTGDGNVKGAITGGDGAYANARGTFTSVGDPATDTFTFTQ